MFKLKRSSKGRKLQVSASFRAIFFRPFQVFFFFPFEVKAAAVPANESETETENAEDAKKVVGNNKWWFIDFAIDCYANFHLQAEKFLRLHPTKPLWVKALYFRRILQHQERLWKILWMTSKVCIYENTRLCAVCTFLFSFLMFDFHQQIACRGLRTFLTIPFILTIWLELQLRIEAFEATLVLEVVVVVVENRPRN